LTPIKTKLLELETRLKAKFSQVQKLENALEKSIGLQEPVQASKHNKSL